MSILSQVVRVIAKSKWPVLLVGGHLAVLAFPEPLFPHTYEHRVFTIHSETPLPVSIDAVLDRASELVARSPLHEPSLRHTVFLTSQRKTFALFARQHYQALAIHSPLRGHIFVAPSHPERDRIRGSAANNTRRLSGVIAHEIVHRLLPRAGWRELPRWKEEGYADYVAGESTYDCGRGIRLLLEGQGDDTAEFRYFKYHLLVAYVLDEQGLTVEEFLRAPMDPYQLEVDMIQHLQRERSVAGESGCHMSHRAGATWNRVALPQSGHRGLRHEPA